MKERNSTSINQMLLSLVIIIISTLTFSCKKNSVDTIPEKSNMTDAAKVISGNLLTGNLRVESNEEEIALDYNNGDKIILVTKIPKTEVANINNMQSAEVITSKYGIILKDLSNNKIFFLVNNDSESTNKFETVQSLFTTGFQSDKIFGTTIVNSEKG